MNSPTNSAKLMQAAISDRYGSPDIIRIGSVPIPAPGTHEVLIKVSYTTVNRTDSGFLGATPFIVRFISGLFRPKFPILGCEFSGVVAKVGAKVTRFKEGDRVFGFKDDDFGFGAHAQYTLIPQHGMLCHSPAQLGDREVAPALEGSHYAMYYIRATGIDSTKRVLVNGGTGAIGSAAVQIIASMGAEVTAVCAGEHAETVRGLGGTYTIDYTKEDFTQSSERYDVVFDAVGKSRYSHSRRVLNDMGCYASSELGPMAQNPFLALRPKRFVKQAVHFPIPANTVDDTQYITDLLQRGAFKPLIDREYVLPRKIGNVVIKMPS